MANKTVFIGFGAVLLIAMVVSIGVLISRSSEKKDDSDLSTSTKAIKAVCEPTTYKETCQKSLEKKGGENVTNPKDLIKMEFEVAIDELKAALDNSSAWKEANKDPMVKQAFHNCRELLHDAIDDLHTSFGEMSKVDVRKADHYIENVKVFLSGAATFQESCLDQFENVTGNFGEKMKKLLNTSRELTSNGLAMMHDFSEVLNSLHVGQKERRLLSNDDFPDWVSAGRRRLLAEPPPADVVVAQDGSGKVKTIAEALALAPDAQNNPTNKPFIIHIKEGVYKEYVTVDKTKANVMFIGDGATKTKITGNKNFIDGVNTMNTATVGKLAKMLNLIKHMMFRANVDEILFMFQPFWDPISSPRTWDSRTAPELRSTKRWHCVFKLTARSSTTAKWMATRTLSTPTPIGNTTETAPSPAP